MMRFRRVFFPESKRLTLEAMENANQSHPPTSPDTQRPSAARKSHQKPLRGDELRLRSQNAGVMPSMDSVGDAYDSATGETLHDARG